ncbi:unnamed protein product, partial [marine sediment metagenome]
VNIPLFLQENYNAKVTALKNNSLLTFAENQFLKYITNLKSHHRFIHMIREDPASCQDQSTFKLLETRYSNSRRKKVRKRMEWLAYQYRKG